MAVTPQPPIPTVRTRPLIRLEYPEIHFVPAIRAGEHSCFAKRRLQRRTRCDPEKSCTGPHFKYRYRLTRGFPIIVRHTGETVICAAGWLPALRIGSVKNPGPPKIRAG